MTHPHCTPAVQRVLDARAAIAALEVPAAAWRRDAMLYELDAIAQQLGEISQDHHALESR